MTIPLNIVEFLETDLEAELDGLALLLVDVHLDLRHLVQDDVLQPLVTGSYQTLVKGTVQNLKKDKIFTESISSDSVLLSNDARIYTPKFSVHAVVCLVLTACIRNNIFIVNGTVFVLHPQGDDYGPKL